MPDTSTSYLSLPAGAKKVKLSVLSFLYEFASIPENARTEYLQKLLKRKNASSQKNVQLLNIIYAHLREDKMCQWDENSICTKLNISKNMLYCHKSRLLKSLRLIYFGWKEIESKEFNVSSEKPENENSLKYEKASRMYEIGMQRESKNEFLKLEKIINARSRINITEKIILIKIYRQLSTHYFTRKKSVRFNLYYKKFERLHHQLMKSEIAKNNPEFQLEISLAQHCFKMYKSFFKIKKDTNYTNTIEIYNQLSALTRKSKSRNRYVLTLLNLGLLNKDIKDYNKALIYFIKGDKLCRRNDLEKESIVFRVNILLTELLAGRSGFEYTLNEVIKCYERSKELRIQGYLKEKILFQCVSLTMFQKDKSLLYKFLFEYNSHCILTNGYQNVARSLYYMKFTFYFHRIGRFRLEYNGREKIPIVYDINPVYKEKLITVVSEVLQNFHKMNSISFKKESLMNILVTEFWMGAKLNFEYAKYIIKEIEWLNKSRGKMLAYSTLLFEALKLCAAIIEGSKYVSKKELLNKYEQRFKELSGKIINDTNEDVLSLYSIFSYTAQITGYEELKNIMIEVYKSLKFKYPDVFQPVLDKINKRKNGVEDADEEAEIRMGFAA